MKKLLIMSGTAMMMMVSCKDKAPDTPVTPPPVEDPAPPVKPEPQTQENPVKKTTTTTTTTTTEEPDGTSVSMGKDGFSMKSKNGDDNNNVTVSKKEVTIQRTE